MGNVILNFIGGCVRWIFGSIRTTLFNKKKFTFKEYIHGPKNSNDYYDMTGHNLVNVVIGILTISFLVWIILYFKH